MKIDFRKNLTIKQVRICVLFSILNLIVGLNCYAQNTDSLFLKVRLLDEVNVKEFLLRKQSTSPSPTQILTSLDLKKTPSLSIADALRFFSGVQLKDYGGIGGLKTVNIRSMGSQYTSVFYDGIQIDNVQNGQVDLGKFSLENLEQISLLSGQSNEILLPAKAFASGSSIFLTTKKPFFIANVKNYLQANIKTGSFGLLNPSINFQHKLNSNINTRFNLAWTTANGKYPFRYTNGVYDTTAIRQNGDVHRLRTEAAIFGKLSKSEWNAQVYSFVSERGLPGAIVANKFDYSQRIWDQNYFVQGNLTQHFHKLSLAFNAKLAYDYTRYLDPEYITSKGFLDNRYHERSAYVSASGNYQINTLLSLGLASDYNFQHLSANLYRFAYPNRNTFLNVINAHFKNKQLQIDAAVLSNTVIDHVELLYNAAGKKQTLNPSLMFSLQPFKNSAWRLRGFYKDIFRMPTFNDLYYTFIGNILLKPEQSKQYNMGVTYAQSFHQSKIKFIDFQTDVYYNKIKDKIIAQPGANLFRWTMYNVGKVSIKGIETNVKTAYTLGKDVSLGLGINYTFQEALDVTSFRDDSYKNQIPYIPKNNGSILGSVDFKQWHLNYSFIYTGYRYNQKANIIYNYMEPWYTHDIAMGYTYVKRKTKLNLNVEINNILNQYYDVVPNFPLPGINYRLNLNVEI